MMSTSPVLSLSSQMRSTVSSPGVPLLKKATVEVVPLSLEAFRHRIEGWGRGPDQHDGGDSDDDQAAADRGLEQ
jgi:hypothetical protein